MNPCLPLSVTLDILGKAVPIDIPGVCVVPENDDVTFTCNTTENVFPTWRVDLKVLGNTTGFADSAQVSSLLPSVSSREGGNPASFIVHNISSKSNGSFVECKAASPSFSILLNTTILVEGESLYVPINHMQ